MHTFGISWTWFYRSLEDFYPSMPISGSVASTLPVGAASNPTDGEPNVAIVYQVSIAASGTQEVDLYALEGAQGAAVNASEIHAVIVTCDTAGGKGNIQRGASDHWTGLGTPTIPFDAKFPFVVGSAAGIAVSNTDKNIKITNNGASTSTYTVYILARG